jgi:hypothetical protein
MTRVALLLPALALLAACGGQPTGEAVQKEEADRAAAVEKMQGFDKAFDSPETAVAAANQFGFRVDGYKQAGLRWQAAGQPIFVAETVAKNPNRAIFFASGAGQAKLDTMRFTLEVTDPVDAKRAKMRFAKIVGDTLWQFRIEQPADVTAAITDETALKKSFAGALASVAIDPISAGEKTRRITVTFTRPDASGQAS